MSSSSSSLHLGILALLAITSGAVSQKVLNNFAVPAAARPGENVTFYCLVDQDILGPSSCQWTRPGGITVTPSLYANDDFELIEYPDSADGKRRCDFTLKGARIEHHGVWKCQPNLVSGPVTESGLAPFKFIVAAAPEPRRPIVRYNGQETTEVQVEAEQEVHLSCSLHRTRPKPQFAWYKVSPTGSLVEPIQGVQATEQELIEPGTEDLKSYSSNITVKVGAHENAMRIRCVANHTMLQEPQSQNSTEVLLSVQGQASVRQCVQIGSGMFQSIVEGYYCDQQAYYLAGKDGMIEVVFSSNPEPKRLEWIVPKFPSNPIMSGEDREGFKAMHWERFHAVGEDPSMEQFDRNDLFSAKLMISELAADVAGRYELRIFNGFVDERTGEQAYRFKFEVQIGEKPPAGLNSGIIVGVIVAILVILAIGCVIFAWRTSRMCFAGRGTRAEGDAESAEPATATEGKTEGDNKKEAATNGKSDTAGMKKRLSKLLPKAASKKNKNKDGSKAEKVPLDEKKQADVEAGPETKAEEGQGDKNDQTTLIYADLDLIKNTSDRPGEKNSILTSEKTEYAEIVGTVNDNPPPPQVQK